MHLPSKEAFGIPSHPRAAQARRQDVNSSISRLSQVYIKIKISGVDNMQTNFNYNPVAGQPIVNQALGQAQQLYAKFTQDPFAGVKTITLNQDPECIECICPCAGEKRNFYTISVSDPSGTSLQHQLGRVEEYSECPQRFFCQCWRAFELNFFTPQGQVICSAKRQYKIPSCFNMPCERPELTITKDQAILGYVKQPFMCCGRSDCSWPILAEMDLVDSNGNTKYYVSSECVQIGCVTRCCFIPRCAGGCRYITFDIYNMMRQKVGQIRNVFNGCCNEYCTKADKFVIDFPENADFADKCLILMATIQIDYDLFETTFLNLP